MALRISQVEVWAAALEDRPGAAAEKLDALAEAGANLEFIVARRTPKKGGGVLYVTPVLGKDVRKAAESAGFAVAEGLHSVRVDGRDEVGVGARMTGALAEAGINMRGISAAAIGDQAVWYLAFDSEEDAGRAVQMLRGLDAS
ncbi:MAG: ACT domain-containing protein [Planctomycetes bacterium]|nr:ACT domain-containing protein [Planctomycetota bacterium]